ncbi:MMPL family transporter [Aquipuribacter nitratireducens]|uniref:MMPL family transporter n=1 Tax=Aquipuribacter nitratireducens TaxID=650104 RepID=A0ABW0GQL6_9MICO
MLSALARGISRRPVLVLVLAGLALALAAWSAFAMGGGLFGKATDGGFDDARSESSVAAAVSTEELGRTDVDVLVTYTSPGRTVADPEFADAVTQTLDDVVAEHADVVDEVVNPLAAPDPAATGLVSADGTTVVALVRLVGEDDAERSAVYAEEVADDLVAPSPLETRRGGLAAVNADISRQVGADLALAEGVMVPIVLLLLVVFLGGLVAGSLPLAIGAFAIVGAFGMVSLIGEVTDVSIFSVNVITALGLGLAVDYGLLLVARFREELTPGRPVPDALEATLTTAGRTVLVSGLTVAVSLAAMLFFPFMFVRSLGTGAIAAVVLAMLAALTVLPAILRLLGRRVDAVGLPFRRGTRAGADRTDGAWARIARGVMRRPVVVVVGVVALLAVLVAPVADLRLGGVDVRALPERAESRQAAETVDEQLPWLSTDAAQVVAVGADGSALDATQQAAVVDAVEAAAGTPARVEATSGTAVRLSVPLADSDPFSAASRELVTDLRDVSVDGVDVLVTGDTAYFVDRLDVITDRLPLAVGFVVVAELLLLFWAFGSVLLPVKAALLNTATIAATFGVLVWAFGEGNLSGVLGFTETGFLETSQLVVIVAIAFGLSMDYEVFLLSRMREEWDATGDNTTAVANGLQRTGGIVTAAALLLGLVVGGFMLGDVTFIQMIGLGLAFALLLDATVVRALLVPATMRLVGSANWWAPGPLARWWERYGLREEPAAVAVVPQPRHRAETPEEALVG